MIMEINLKGKTALVCGASQGIGKAIAMQLAMCGANIIAVARSVELLNSLITSLNNDDIQRHFSIVADFSEPEIATEIIKKNVPADFGIDILVNNTGGPPPSAAHLAAISEYRRAFDMHIVMSQLLTQLVIPQMKQKNFGRIINIISVGAKQPIENLGVSNTIRGAMVNWSKTLSRELAQYGITVNNILPGYTKTPRLEALIKIRAEKEQKLELDVEKEIVTKIPAKRLGKPEEIAFLAAFLASDYAGYINGVSIPVDGGFLGCS